MEEVKELKGDLVRGLKAYFNNDTSKVKAFGIQLKALGFNLDDLETLKQFRARSEALVVLLGLFDFGALGSVTNCVDHLRGRGNPDQFLNGYVKIFGKTSNN